MNRLRPALAALATAALVELGPQALPSTLTHRLTPACTLEPRAWILAVGIAGQVRPPDRFTEHRAVACMRAKGGTGADAFAPLAILMRFPDTER